MKKCKRDVENPQGFRVLQVSRTELEQATQQVHCVCDDCMSSPEYGYYVAVLNRWLCPKCYSRWIKAATRYQEDIWVEEKNYQFYRNLLGYE